jgi:hypothetical protein
MDLMSFIWGLSGDMLKNKLLQAWVEPHRLEWVDFHNMEQLNQLAEQIMPWLIKSNPTIANMIKQNANLVGDKKNEVVEVINKL